MRKLLYILLLLPVLVFGQTIENNRIVLREKFTSEFDVRRNSGQPTDVTFSNRVGVFNGSSSKIEYSQTLYNVQSVQIDLILNSITEDILKLSSSHSIEVGSGTVTATGFTSPTIYVDGTATATITTGEHQIIVTTGTVFNADDVIYGTVTGFLDGSIDLSIIYNYVLAAEEISNLYNNRRFRDIGQANEIINVSAQSGSITDRQGNTLTNTATTVFKYGDASVMEFNGSSSVIETTIANTINTISFWVYTDDLTQSIADFGSGNTVTVSGGTITAAWADNIYINGVTGTDISINEWFLVTLTDAGVAVTDIDIGKEGANFYKGFLNDFRLYDSILTTEEISQLFSSTKHLYAK